MSCRGVKVLKHVAEGQGLAGQGVCGVARGGEGGEALEMLGAPAQRIC